LAFACACRSGQVAERSKAADCKSAGPCGLRRFESSPVHQKGIAKGASDDGNSTAVDCVGRCASHSGGGSNSGVESRPSKPLVAGSNPVSRSRRRFATRNWKFESSRALVGELAFRPFSLLLSGVRVRRADVAQLVERVLGKDEVSGSIPLIGSKSGYRAGCRGRSGVRHLYSGLLEFGHRVAGGTELAAVQAA
jgi:hypothetical protein